jgi:hypothetical protein
MMNSKLSFLLMPTAVILAITALIAGCGGGGETTPPVTPSAPATAPEPTAPWSANGVIDEGEYAGTAQYGDFQVSWRHDGEFIYMGIRAKTSGFVSVGIQPGRTMKDADIIFGWVEGGAATVMDHHSTGNFGPHSPDTEMGGTEDILESGGSEDGGFTTIEFKRALDTGDTYDNVWQQGSNKIIYAYGSNDSREFKHSTRGYGEIILN